MARKAPAKRKTTKKQGNRQQADPRRFIALHMYLTNPDRSHGAVYDAWKTLGAPGRVPSMSSLAKWSTEDGWVIRAEEHDRGLVAAATTSALEDDAKVLAGHRQMAMAMRSITIRGLAEYANDPGKIPASALAQMARTSVDIERLSMGLATERLTVTHEIAARIWQVFQTTVTRDDIGATIRRDLSNTFRASLVGVMTSETIQGGVPEWLEKDEDLGLTDQEAAAASLAIEATRRGMDAPDLSGFPPMPAPGKYGAEVVDMDTLEE